MTTDISCPGNGLCNGNGACNHLNGKCECNPGFYGAECESKLNFKIFKQLLLTYEILKLDTNNKYDVNRIFNYNAGSPHNMQPKYRI